ncbi:MAG: hypothetical protein IJI83_06230 [Oscillospiraceae bacterium]|nr:hypothetical protein [Oscillospiraceae bacterium]
MQKNENGYYTWTYSMDMWQNRSIINLVLKIVLGIMALLYLFMMFLVFSDGFDFDRWWWVTKIILACVAAIVVISYFAYWLVSKYFGGVYTFIYEMDDETLHYYQPEDQKEKTQNIGAAATIVGLATKNFGTASAGMMTANGVNETVRFEKIRKVGKKEDQNLITMSGLIMHHMIYADDVDYDFVYDFICEHCTNAKIKA